MYSAAFTIKIFICVSLFVFLKVIIKLDPAHYHSLHQTVYFNTEVTAACPLIERILFKDRNIYAILEIESISFDDKIR